MNCVLGGKQKYFTPLSIFKYFIGLNNTNLENN